MYPDKVFQMIFNAIVCLCCKTNLCCRLHVIYVMLHKTRSVIKQDVFTKVILSSASHEGQM